MQFCRHWFFLLALWGVAGGGWAAPDPLWTLGTNWHLKDLEWEEAQKILRPSVRNIVVAVIDSGAVYHPLLVKNFYLPGERPISPTHYGIDLTYKGSWLEDLGFYDKKRHTPEEEHRISFHGTHGAGLIVSVAPAVKLLILKSHNLDFAGGGEYSVKAIELAAEYDVDLINLSMGFHSYPEVLKAALEKAWAKNILLVSACGNYNVDTFWDGVRWKERDLEKRTEDYFLTVIEHPLLLKVGGHDYEGRYLPMIFYGPRYIEISAPGEMLYSITEADSTIKKALTGSSQATFVASGVVALLMSQYPKGLISHQELTEILISSSKPLPDLADKVRSGGKLNLPQALRQLHRLIDEKMAQTRLAPSPANQRRPASEPPDSIRIPLMRGRLSLPFY